MKAKTWDGNSINDTTNYQAVLRESFYGLPAVRPVNATRTGRWPVLAGLERPGRVIELDIYIKNLATKTTLQDQIFRWFDPESEVAKKLICEDDAGGNDRFVYAICQSLDEAPRSAGLHYHAILALDGDVRWRENTATTDSWSITASGQTKALTNNGKDDAYPLFTVRPTSSKTGSYAYRRWVSLVWMASGAATRYPVDVGNDAFNTSTLVSGGKMQADGDDLRVEVDGVEVERWLDGINTTTTKVWCNLDFLAAATATLGVAIASSGAITTITASTDISGFPSSGILLIDAEAFVYTGRINSSKQFTGVTRASKGTSMAAHTTSDTIYWVQHDIWVLYGNSSATAPVLTTANEPVFELDDSTNTSWDYDEFRDAAGARPGSWQNVANGYGADHMGSAVDPWVECGVYTPSAEYPGIMRMFNPCGITAANFQNGEKYATYTTDWGTGKIQSSIDGITWTDEDSVSAPSTGDTWEAWSDNETLVTGSRYVQLQITAPVGVRSHNSMEAADVTLSLNSSYTPTVVMGSEIGNYTLDCTIANTTTGESIELDYTMQLNQYLMVDTDSKLVYLVDDGSNQFQALTVVAGPRKDWLRLQPGSNTWQFTDVGTNGVSVAFTWYERHYQ